MLNVPLVVSEQYPERLGSTVSELDVQHACAIVPKTKFSMMVPDVQNMMKNLFSDKPKTAVLFGIEVRFSISNIMCFRLTF